MAEMVRVNTRISSKLNAWLDKESDETGIPKSTLIMLALENFCRERTALSTMGDMAKLMEFFEEFKKQKGD